MPFGIRGGHSVLCEGGKKQSRSINNCIQNSMAPIESIGNRNVNNERPTSFVPQFQNPFQNIPKVPIFVAATVAVMSILGHWAAFADFFALNPSKVLSRGFHVWSFFTAQFIEVSIFGLIIAVAVILLAGKWLIPLWGQKEFILFTLSVNVISTVGLFFLLVFAYMVTGMESIWFASLPYGGFSAALAGYSVVLKQLTPDAEMKFFFFFPLRAKFFPVVVVCISLVLTLLFGLGTGSSLLALNGVFVAWFYLRFAQRHSVDLGDHSNEFSFASFFPERAQPVVNRGSEYVTAAVDKVGIRGITQKYILPRWQTAENVRPSAPTIQSPSVGAGGTGRRLGVRRLGEIQVQSQADKIETGLDVAVEQQQQQPADVVDLAERERRRLRGLSAVDARLKEQQTRVVESEQHEEK